MLSKIKVILNKNYEQKDSLSDRSYRYDGQSRIERTAASHRPVQHHIIGTPQQTEPKKHGAIRKEPEYPDRMGRPQQLR